jgi:signal recognition particle receptor subunit beta
VYHESLPSLASIQTNASTFTIKNETSSTTLNLIDIPGHPRIRNQFKEHLKNACAVVFVVDAATVSRTGSTVAEYVSLRALLNRLIEHL